MLRELAAVIGDGGPAPGAAGASGHPRSHALAMATKLAPLSSAGLPWQRLCGAGLGVRHVGTGRYRVHPADRDRAPEWRGVCRVALSHLLTEVSVPGHRWGTGEEWFVVDAEEASAKKAPEASSIGARAKSIRLRRGLSLDVVAGLAGISKPYLSLLENGHRGFNRRGLVEDLAEALCCSVADLTGQPYAQSAGRWAAGVLASLDDIRLALNDYVLDEIPIASPRPLEALVSQTDGASAYRDQARYNSAGQNLRSGLLLELQSHAFAGKLTDRQTALAALVDAWMIAAAVAKNFGYNDLSRAATQRGHDYAELHGGSGVLSFARWYLALGLMRVAARNRAAALLAQSINDFSPSVQLTTSDTTVAQMVGLMHLSSAQTAARSGSSDEAHSHLDEADRIAQRVGEGNALRRHFGPTNVACWRVAVGIELGEGGSAYADATRLPIDVQALGSDERTSALHLDFSRALAQEDGQRDLEAIRHLDAADRIAQQLIRLDPLARDLLMTLDRRAKYRIWELDSLCNRFGIRARG
jgi:transcriptional regulator with XRE-family HTH domain